MYSQGTPVNGLEAKAVNTSGAGGLASVFQGEVCACHCYMTISVYVSFKYLELKFLFLDIKTKGQRKR